MKIVLPEPSTRGFKRVVISQQQVSAHDLSVNFCTENIGRPTDWRMHGPHHTIVVHLAGHLQQMESVFAQGPSSSQLPSIGDVWTIPADSSYAALARGGEVRFVEFKVPPEMLGGGDLAPRIGHRDDFLHQASVRAAALVSRQDDLGRMALTSLLETVRCHLADVYLRGSMKTRQSAGPSRRFSERQCQRLEDYIAATLRDRLSVDSLATAIGVSTSHLLEGFKATFGTTPWQFVLRTRLAKAVRLLETSDTSITEIAAATGFSSPSHLSTAFGQHFGLSPVAFRKQQRAGAPAHL